MYQQAMEQTMRLVNIIMGLLLGLLPTLWAKNSVLLDQPLQKCADLFKRKTEFASANSGQSCSARTTTHNTSRKYYAPACCSAGLTSSSTSITTSACCASPASPPSACTLCSKCDTKCSCFTSENA